jgi:hypothetical protein
MRNALIVLLVSLLLNACGGGGGGGTSTFSITGTIIGYAGQLTLSNNGTPFYVTSSASSTTTFTVASNLSAATPYNVTVTSPSGYDCAVANGSGNATTDVSDIAVTCAPWQITATISGYDGTVAISNNGATAVNFTSTVAGSTIVIDPNAGTNTTYAITVPTSPTDYFCSVANGSSSGPLTGSVSNVVIHCVKTNGTWGLLASMSTDRVNHTATLLDSGKVLVTGGLNATNVPQQSAEVYDPIANTWTDTTVGKTASNHLSSSRYLHTATLMEDGSGASKVLVVGGIGGLATSDVYDPATGLWTQTTGNLTVGRYNHTATWLPSVGKVLVAGGSDVSGTSLDSAELFDPATLSWTPVTATLSVARASHSATLVGSSVVLAGGNNSGPLLDTEIYDIATETFAPSANLNHARFDHTATLLPDDSIIVVGGNDSATGTPHPIEYPEKFSVSQWSNMPIAANDIGARYGHSALFRASDNTVLVSCGTGAGGVLAGATRIFDTLTGTWVLSGLGDLNVRRYNAASTVLLDGSVLVIGGKNSANNVIKTIEVYR